MAQVLPMEVYPIGPSTAPLLPGLILYSVLDSFSVLGSTVCLLLFKDGRINRGGTHIEKWVFERCVGFIDAEVERHVGGLLLP